MTFIELKNIKKTFNNIDVLKNINIVIEEGDVLGILGRSGAGKSVIMHMLRGMKEYKPDEGQIIFNIAVCPNCLRIEPPSFSGKKCKCDSNFENEIVDFWNCEKDLFLAIKKRIAIMLQRTFALYEEDSVIDNILKSINSDYTEEDIQKALQLLELTQMTHRITHIARDLSGGEKQRVVLARQLAKDPMLLLADEPTGTLDPKTADLLHKALLEGIKSEGRTMVITSHWPEVVNKLSDKVIWLDKGEIIDQGNPETVVSDFMKEIPESKRIMNFKIGDPIIRMDNIKKYYYSIERGVIKSVDGVTLDINEGEIFGLVGLSGAGKTTLSEIIFGLTDPSSGEISIKLGDDWIDMTHKGPLGRGRIRPYLGLLHQEFSLYPNRNVLGNLTDAISLKLPAEFGKMKANLVLKSVGFEDDINDLLYKMPSELSAGEQHRIALAQVLIKEPKIIILDEPTGTMDPITRTQVIDSIIKAREDLNQTFLIISHDMDFVSNICDRTALMRDGKILKVGKPGNIIIELTSNEKEKML